MTFEEFAEKVHKMAAGRYSCAGRKVGFNGCGANEWSAYIDAGDPVSASAKSARGCLSKLRKRLALAEGSRLVKEAE